MKAIFLILDKASFRNHSAPQGFSFSAWLKRIFIVDVTWAFKKLRHKQVLRNLIAITWISGWYVDRFFFYFFFSLYFHQKVECSSCLQGLMLSDCHPGSLKYICMDGLSGTVFASHRGCLICLVWHCYGLRGTTVVFPIMLEAIFSRKKSENRL